MTCISEHPLVSGLAAAVSEANVPEFRHSQRSHYSTLYSQLISTTRRPLHSESCKQVFEPIEFLNIDHNQEVYN